jgi:hypothetical protein
MTHLPAAIDTRTPDKGSPILSARSRAPLVVTWIATVVSAAFGLAGAVGGSGTFDPVVALATVTAIGVAWYTYFTRQGIAEARARDEHSLRERRTSVATAVLAELANVTARLQNLRRFGASEATRDFVAAPALDHACSYPELFSPPTVQSLLEARHRLRDVQLWLDSIEKRKALALTTDDAAVQKLAVAEGQQLSQQVVFRVAWAYKMAVRLVDDLRAEGGSMPELGEPAVAEVEQIDLPPDPFPRPPG